MRDGDKIYPILFECSELNQDVLDNLSREVDVREVHQMEDFNQHTDLFPLLQSLYSKLAVAIISTTPLDKLEEEVRNTFLGELSLK